MNATARIVSRLGMAVMASGTGAFAGDYPVTIDNCGASLRFDAAPERVIGLGQNSTEILMMLGLQDRIAGSAIWVSPVLDDLAEAEATVPRISDTTPGFEAVVARDPDLLAVQFNSSVGPDGRIGTPEQFADLGIPTYLSPTNCGTDTRGNGDGSRERLYSNALLYTEVDELSRIFGVPDRGRSLVAEMSAREEAVRGRAADGVSILYWFSSPEVAGDAWVAGKNGAPGYINSLLGAGNVIDSEEEWPLVGWETIAALDPTVIVIGTMDRRNQPADDPAVKRDFLATDPLARELTAVREGRIVEMDAQAMNPTLRTVQGAEVLARALDDFGLLK
ncbi:ABC transporter substrate-binding protein [Cereibacter sp. SYSU M97828]|nr:ABC transporter substrate-binding protein [Cereibacter flavus]